MSDSTAISLTLPSLTSDTRQQLLEEKPLLSLYEVFATIPDPRSKHGQRYELPYLLTCLVAALLCNCNSTLAVAQWCCDHRELLTQCFGARLHLCPDDSLYRWLLPRLDAEQIECALADWICTTLQAKPDDPIADRLARRFVGHAQMRMTPLTYSPSAHITVRKHCYRPLFLRKPTRSQ